MHSVQAVTCAGRQKSAKLHELQILLIRLTVNTYAHKITTYNLQYFSKEGSCLPYIQVRENLNRHVNIRSGLVKRSVKLKLD
jgi:hypothetical protein